MKFILFLILTLCLSQTSVAQTTSMKIGYANVEMIMLSMPDVKQIESNLRTFQSKIEQQLQTKQAYAEGKLGEYQQKKEGNTFKAGEEDSLKRELIKLDEEIKAFASEQQRVLGKKEGELLKPLQDKVKKAIDEVAKEENYTHVFNSYVSQTSVLITAPPDDDLTPKVLKKLNVAPPTPKPGGK